MTPGEVVEVFAAVVMILAAWAAWGLIKDLWRGKR